MQILQNLSLYFGSINNGSTQKTSSKVSSGTSSYYSAGQTPISGEPGVETMGLAVFNKDKLVGELNGFESICHLIVSNKLKNAQIRVPSPIEELEYIDLYLEPNGSTKNSVSLVKGSPYITVKVKLTAIMQSMNENINLKDDDIVSKIETSAQNFLTEHINNYLYKTSKELHADIDSFGLYALKYFYTKQEADNYNWLSHYKDAFFDIDVQVNLRSSYLLVNTSENKSEK